MVVQNVMTATSRDNEVRRFEFRMKKRRELTDLAKLFRALDANRNGKINAEELQKGLQSEAVQILMDKAELDPKDTELFFTMLAGMNREDEVDVNHFVDAC